MTEQAEYNQLPLSDRSKRMSIFGVATLAISLVLKIISTHTPTGSQALEFWHIVFFMWSLLFFISSPWKIERIKD